MLTGPLQYLFGFRRVSSSRFRCKICAMPCYITTATQLNSTQLNSTQLNSTQLNSTQLNSTQLNSTPAQDSTKQVQFPLLNQPTAQQSRTQHDPFVTAEKLNNDGRPFVKMFTTAGPSTSKHDCDTVFIMTTLMVRHIGVCSVEHSGSKNFSRKPEPIRKTVSVTLVFPSTSS